MKLSMLDSYDEPIAKLYHIKKSYREMVALLGEPNTEWVKDEDKVDVTWSMETEKGDILAVRNYKNGPSYLGSAFTLDDIDVFSVRASSFELLEYLGIDTLREPTTLEMYDLARQVVGVVQGWGDEEVSGADVIEWLQGLVHTITH